MHLAGRPGLGQWVGGRPLLPEGVQGRAGAFGLDGVAALELGWAVRLRLAPRYDTASGMHDAVASLKTHAAWCCDSAGPLLGSAAKEVERAPEPLIQ